MWAWLALITLIHAEPTRFTAAVIERRSACKCREEMGVKVFTLVLISAMAVGIWGTQFTGMGVYVEGAIDTPTVGQCGAVGWRFHAGGACVALIVCTPVIGRALLTGVWWVGEVTSSQAASI